MELIENLISVLFIIAIPVSWILSDTITEFLYSGKSAMPNELKPFNLK